MEAINTKQGFKIKDMFLGIDSLRQEGDANRWELKAMPQDKLAALGTKMYITIEFDETFKTGNGATLEFKYDNFTYTEMFGVDKTPTRRAETFAFLPPYKSPKIRSKGAHKLTINIANKVIKSGELEVSDIVESITVPYNIV